MRAIPKITVRIDRGEDWVEMSGDAFDNTVPPVCGQGETDEWCHLGKVIAAWRQLLEAVIE